MLQYFTKLLKFIQFQNIIYIYTRISVSSFPVNFFFICFIFPILKKSNKEVKSFINRKKILKLSSV